MKLDSGFDSREYGGSIFGRTLLAIAFSLLATILPSNAFLSYSFSKKMGTISPFCQTLTAGLQHPEGKEKKGIKKPCN